MVSEQADLVSDPLLSAAEITEMREELVQLQSEMAEFKILMKEWLWQRMKEEDLDPGGNVASFTPPTLLPDVGVSASVADTKLDQSSRMRSRRRRRCHRRFRRSFGHKVQIFSIVRVVTVGGRRFALSHIKRGGKIKKVVSDLPNCLIFISFWLKARVLAEKLLMKLNVANLVGFLYMILLLISCCEFLWRMSWDPGGFKLKTSTKVDCLMLDLVSSNAVQERCCKELGFMNDAEKVLETMSALRIGPDVVSFRHLDKAHEIVGIPEKEKCYVADFLGSHEKDADDFGCFPRRLVPFAESYSTSMLRSTNGIVAAICSLMQQLRLFLKFHSKAPFHGPWVWTLWKNSQSFQCWVLSVPLKRWFKILCSFLLQCSFLKSLAGLDRSLHGVLPAFSLLSRSGVLENLIGNLKSKEGSMCNLQLHDIPGFEHLQMTEEYGEANLIAQTEVFLNEVLCIWKDSIRVLETYEDILLYDEELNIVSGCINSLAAKACADPTLSGWQVTGKGSSRSTPHKSGVLWNGIGACEKAKGVNEFGGVKDCGSLESMGDEDKMDRGSSSRMLELEQTVVTEPIVSISENALADIDGIPGAYLKYLHSLNDTQIKAACSDVSIPLMIVVVPRSGKTSTMVRRVLTLLSKGIGPSNILAMTFTTVATSEIRDRSGKVTGKAIAKKLFISTFHSFNLQLCRSHAVKLERIPDFLIYGNVQHGHAVIEVVHLSESMRKMVQTCGVEKIGDEKTQNVKAETGGVGLIGQEKKCCDSFAKGPVNMKTSSHGSEDKVMVGDSNEVGSNTKHQITMLALVNSYNIGPISNHREEIELYTEQGSNALEISELGGKLEAKTPKFSSFFVEHLDNFEDEMVIDLSGGDLVNLLKGKGTTLREDEARLYVAQMVVAIECIHKLNYAHRDIKLQNTLLDSRSHVKLCDFGLCIPLDSSPSFEENTPDKTQQERPEYFQENKHGLAYLLVGTSDYIAPDVMLESGHGLECDWCSLGAVMSKMIFTKPPFIADDPDSTHDMIRDWKSHLHFPQADEV